MSDPFRYLIAPQGEVRYAEAQQNLTFELWRKCHIALPDLHIAKRGDFSFIKEFDETGEPMTPERMAELFKDVPPMFKPVKDGDNANAELSGVDYRNYFQNLTTERYGATAVKLRPKTRYIPPEELKLDIDASALPTTET
jgi:hypothetical protein